MSRQGEPIELLSRAIEGLPPQMRRCVRLRVLQDLDYDEIAEILQLSPSTVKVQLFKARKRLQAELGDAFTDGVDPRSRSRALSAAH